ncbi:signal transduction histidine kinase [Streptomyces sp. LBL]|uniref:sensor histidine kinase n=1 Tax=Streptomyces sp. LBL TaxID=2940562 RepID=UPI002474CF8E|nr:histidine kinase [Streptomyces sp. LBL]MDH6622335.1 signal transduction histidine kinase [Streptomyces sp. LBL]
MRRFGWLHHPTDLDASRAEAPSTARRQDMALAVLIVVMQVIAASLVDRTWQVPHPVRVVLILLSAIVLLGRRRQPLLVAVLTVIVDSAMPILPPHQSWLPMASLVALYTLATHRERRLSWSAGAGAGLWLTLASVLARPGEILGALVYFDYAIVAVAVGDSVRNRRAYLAQAQERAVQAERTREEEAQRRVREERIRIARELHDVVAHHITLVNAQAGVARHLMRSHPDKAYEALSHITETSAAALDELRSTVSLLRREGDPPPTLQPAPTFDQLNYLLDSFRHSGLDVRFQRDGEARPLAASADLAAYRIVQESLTNAQKHGSRPTADVQLTYTDQTLWISVINPARQGQRGGGTGHGLIGMRERADAAHGTLTTALPADGTFRVNATLPLQPAKNDEPGSNDVPAKDDQL